MFGESLMNMEEFHPNSLDNYTLDNYKRYVLNKKLFFSPPESEPKTYQMQSDPVSWYSVNSYGSRSEEFKEGTELLAAGCSFTFGSGISDVNNLWWNKVADSLGFSRSSISFPGVSITWLVDRIFEYFYSFGHPKYLLCLMPDLYRMEVPIEGETLKSDGNSVHGTSSWNGDKYFSPYNHHEHVTNKSKYLKRPFNFNEVISTDLVIESSIRSIRHLEAYCKTAGITLIWSSWDYDLEVLAKKLQETDLNFENYISLGGPTFNVYTKQLDHYKEVLFHDQESKDKCKLLHEYVECDCYIKCHEKERHEFDNDSLFDCGTDTENGVFHAHHGVHMQVHYYETFLKKLNDSIAA